MHKQVIENIKSNVAYERARKGPPDGFPSLPDIPVERYTDTDFHSLEQKALWGKSWLYVAHVDELPEVGDFFLWTHGSTPIFLIRDANNDINAFYNTCRHRGAPIVSETKGNSAGGLVCRYHGWTYSHKGKLVNLRDRRDFVGLDLKCRSLYPVRCELFGNWIFINEDLNAEPLLEHLGLIVDDFKQMKPEKLRFVERHGFEVKCNVKILIDAFLEVYHLKSIHQHTVDRFLDHRGTTISLWKNGHSRMITPWRSDDWVDPGTAGMKEIKSITEIPRNHNCSYNIFPNFIAPIDLTGVPILNFWPIDKKTMYVECHWFTPDLEGEPLPELWKKRIENFDRILEEDTQFAPSIQNSMQSKVFKGIPLNYQERRIYHWHERLDELIGCENIPKELKIARKLAKYIENFNIESSNIENSDIESSNIESEGNPHG